MIAFNLKMLYSTILTCIALAAPGFLHAMNGFLPQGPALNDFQIPPNPKPLSQLAQRTGATAQSLPRPVCTKSTLESHMDAQSM